MQFCYLPCTRLCNCMDFFQFIQFQPPLKFWFQPPFTSCALRLIYLALLMSSPASLQYTNKLTKGSVEKEDSYWATTELPRAELRVAK